LLAFHSLAKIVMNWIERLFSTSGFMPHGFCYTWDPHVIWLNGASDGLIALAYYTIPVTLVYFVRRRKDLAFHWMFLCFALFIVACGTTHAIELWSIWHPAYWLAGAIKALTAAASIGTAAALIQLVPKALSLPSPDDLKRANRALQEAQQALIKTNEELERRVVERTASLALVNTALQTEIEERKRTDAYLSEAQRLSHTGSFGWDVSSGKIYWSQETFRIFGYDSTIEPTVELVLARTHPQDRALVQQVIDRVSLERKDFDLEHRLQMPDDSVKYLRVVGHPSKTESGSFEFVGAVMDITERELAEAKARKHHEELAHMSRVAIMGEMAGALAHELNQPLTGMVNNASAGRRFIAKGRGDLPKLDGLFKAVAKDGRRAGEIIHGIRAMVHKGKEVRDPVNLNDVITSVLRFVHSDAIEHQCVLLTERGRELPLVEANRVQLQQVLLNLVVNAFEAMRVTPAAQRRVIIRSERESGDRVRVSVRDFGTGLPTEEPERIFERFFSTKREGMGMGLAIARSIITSHGGELAAANAEGGGACVHFSLPAIGKASG
jgi:signal transduction histidine kinase